MKDSNALDLEELLQHDSGEEGLKTIINLVAQTSWWVSPNVYQAIQVVYPKTRRKKGLKESRGQTVEGIRLWDNQPASHAFWVAMGEDRRKIKNFYVCHIYEKSVWDPAHFTNLANMTAFPRCLQSLSEWKPVTDVLKYHSYKIYGYKGPEGEIPTLPKYYPAVWRHISKPNQEETKRIIRKLEEQSTKRPSFIHLVELGGQVQ